MWNNNTSPGFKYQPRKKIWKDGKNNYFDPELFIAKSYDWWVYVAKIKGKVVFNAYPYSITTQGHQRSMRKLLEHLKIKIDVEVSTRESLHNFSDTALYSKYESLFNLELFGPRKKGYKKEDLKKEIELVKQSIKVLRQLGCKMSRLKIKELKQRLIEDDKRRASEAKEERLRLKALKVELKPQLSSTSPLNLFSKEIASLQPITLFKGE